ncbi:MAG: PilN domain-containing protein [Zoogloeaceae bacterium]|jgi:type IV pilus assembly protein PilN|nr:PilN domain-containing protein [Zoogloeaceae bacterium]
MIRINLLPYKEELRKAKRQQFSVLAVAFAAAAALAVFVAYQLYDVAIGSQNSRNQILQAGIDSTKRQLQEIEEIKAKSAALLGRKNAIESLQKDRNNTVRLLSEMVQQTPEGIYLTSLQQTGANVEIKGYAQSSSRVSILMRNIEASRWMSTPMLKEVKAVVVRGRRVPEFTLTFQAVDKGEAAAGVTGEGTLPAVEDEGAAPDVAVDADAAAGGAPESALPPPAPTIEGEAATAPAAAGSAPVPAETAKEG